MPRGPLPKPNARRRNAATIATTKLPAGGRPGPAPRVPKPYALANAGRAWWRWAWKQPQSVHWAAGHVYAVLRRALLEDQLAALDPLEDLDLQQLLRDACGLDDKTLDATRHLTQRVEAAMRGLRQVAGGSAGVMREMRELDKALGLTPKGMADLRWTIVADTAAEKEETTAGTGGSVTRLRPRAVDSAG